MTPLEIAAEVIGAIAWLACIAAPFFWLLLQ